MDDPENTLPLKFYSWKPVKPNKVIAQIAVKDETSNLKSPI